MGGSGDLALAVFHDHPLDDGGGGAGIDAEVSEVVEALGAVVHGVGGDVGEDGPSGEGPGLAVAFAGDDFVERMGADGGVEVGGDFVEHGEELLGRALLVFEGRTDGAASEHVRPAEHGAEDVGEGVVEGAGAHVEALVELVHGEGGAGLEEVAGGPAVVGEEDVGGVARGVVGWGGGHGEMVTGGDATS